MTFPQALPSWRTFALSAALFLSPTALTAQGFSVGPVRIAMTADHPSASVEVRSGDFTSQVLVQTTAFVWTENEGERELLPTDELTVTPAVFRLDPGGVRTVIVRAATEGDVPRYYRIRVEEVADEASEQTNTTQLRMLRAFDLPVFLEASGSAPVVTAEAHADPTAGEARVRLRNEGTAYAMGTAVRLRAGVSTLTEESGLYYLLPGASREVVLTLPETGSSPTIDLTFEVEGGEGEILIQGDVETMGVADPAGDSQGNN